ncbi:restriction endonuclease subunit S [Shewanella mangrovisoli]|uniref:restriction endonuclease subunit S n=1 Tax=Shewanella mangrovisoli TaxID=2864211 RepID=UPI001C6601C3|nr:restriction endonuclease subunit S [Shewanella mangrovisoli]QYK08854.1 restriction endonuclease subunit S [Shewanella mangrovisoli]
MSCNWPLKRISEVANFENNKRIPLKSLDREKRQGIYPYYGASGVVDHIDDFIFDGRYLLISEDGENLRTRNTPIAFQASGKFWVNNHAHILSEKEEGILDYLEYYFSVLNIGAYITGAVQPKLNKANLDKIEIPIPPKDERIKLNNILNSFKYKVALNSETNQTLEQMAQAIFKSWFVDFEPVKAKMNGEQPEGMDAATASLFPEKFVESELGLIPEGWEVSTLSSLIQLTGGGTPKRSEETYWNGDIPWFSVRDVPSASNVFVVDTEEKITELGLKKSSTKLLPKGTTIITARGTVGKLALVGTDMCMNQSCYGIRGKDIGDYYNYFNLKEAVSTLQRNTHGGVFDTITTKTFDTYSMAFSGVELANKFDAIVAPLLQKIEANVRQNIELATLRDTLLPNLLSGEIELKKLGGDNE